MVINIYTVYIHTNLVNGKKYVGITSCKPEVRWKKGYGYSEKLPIGRAFRKYGWDAFSHEIVYEGLTELEAKEIEIRLISELNTQDPKFGYNICSGGDGVTGWHPTEETKKKISDAMKGRSGSKNSNFGHKWSDEMKAAASDRSKNMLQETRDLISQAAKKRIGELNPFYGKHHNDETKKMLSDYAKNRVGDKNGNFGHKWTEEMKSVARERSKNMPQEARKKISEAAKKRSGELNSFYGKHHSEETKKKIAEGKEKKVDMLDKDMNVIETFQSMTIASKSTGIHIVAISNCCRGKVKTAGGYIWRYV